MNAELDDLLHRYLDGVISPDEMQTLNRRLAADPDARRELLNLLNLDSALAEAAIAYSVETDEAALLAAERPPSPAGADQDVSRTDASRTVRRAVFGPATWRLAAALAVVGVVLLAIVVVRRNESARRNEFARPAFARVLDQWGVESLPVGRELFGELQRFESGTVAMRTERGVRIAIEAPAEFRFESAQRLHLVRGRASADVPPDGRGFTIVTSSGEVIDLGTRFGVDASSQQAVEVHVFQGEVLTGATGAKQRQSLQTGDAVTIAHGETTARELRSAAFMQADELAELRAGSADEQRRRADGALQTLRRDPACIAVLDFETGDEHPGVYRAVQGRWPGARAVEFVDVGDHLRLDVGGRRDWPQLTLAAWVRLDRLGAPYQSLLHTDGWDRNNFGQVHWMVTRLATMRLALFGNTLEAGSDEQFGFPDSKTSVLPEQGRWMHLATVYDAPARTVRFYLNGRFDKQSRQAVAHPARLGPAQIGNWDASDRKLSGRIDEFMLLGRAMTDSEIRELYQAGNPYGSVAARGATP